MSKNQDVFYVLRFHDDAKIPLKAGNDCAGFDLYSVENCVIRSQHQRLINTGIKMQIPRGYYGRIAPRSSLALRYELDVHAGVIDASYRGEVKVLLFNHSPQDYKVSKGDRIAQLILEKISDINKAIDVTPEIRKDGDIEIRETVTHNGIKCELTETYRGEGGFGSTGK